MRVTAAHHERARAEAALAADFAPAFNAVALLGPGETALSAAFRWMLDERESHGQGGRFRDLFFQHVLEDGVEDWDGARVSCEVSTRNGDGRIDLLIESRDGQVCVAIENKPWAIWQTDQIARYLDDQQSSRLRVRVHALIGGSGDATEELRRHWRDDRTVPRVELLPVEVSASDYTTVTRWIQACAEAARPERVRGFLFDLARYCRSTVLMEPAMTDSRETASLILAGGPDALRAAYAVEAAMRDLTRELTEAVSARLGGSRDMVGKFEAVRLEVDGVPFAFALFGLGQGGWVGVTDEQWVASLDAKLGWEAAEKQWPRWIYLRDAGEEGRSLNEAVLAFDLDAIVLSLPRVARLLINT